MTEASTLPSPWSGPATDRKIIRPPWVPDRDPAEVPAEVWATLREPFPASQIGHKPTVWCKPCRDSPQKFCGNHQKKACGVCRQNITTAHIDLDFVGHAAVTQRILETDPMWAWWPMPEDERVKFDFPNPGSKGKWIWLDILGQIRPGLGETEGGQLEGANQVKAWISDAIKNASMRFGIAIETWSKEDLAAERARERDDADKASRGEPTSADEMEERDPSAPPQRNWAQEIGTAETREEFERLTEECKTAGEFVGAALAAARSQKSKFDKLDKSRPAES